MAVASAGYPQPRQAARLTRGPILIARHGKIAAFYLFFDELP